MTMTSPAARPPTVAVTLDGVSRTYRSARETCTPSQRHPRLPARHFTAVMGPSGSGKTTLLQVAAGLDRPTQGQLVVGDTPLGGLARPS